MSLILILVFVIFSVSFSILTYNKMITLDNRIENSWSQIDVQLKRRHDLIPNLVETVQGYMDHEKETLEGVIQARSSALTASSPGQQAKAESELNGALSKLMLLVEDYPDLKANENFRELKEELVSTENRISFARQNYNDQILFFNNKIEIFPSNLIASIFSFKAHEYFEIEDQNEREAVDVSFSS